MSGEVHILKGFDAIVNPDNVRSGVDLKALERQMISGGIVTQTVREKDPSDKLNDALSIAAKKLGINFDDVGTSKRPAAQNAQTTSTERVSSPYRAPQTPQRTTPAQRDNGFGTPVHNNDDGDDQINDHHEDNGDNEDDDSDHGDYRPEETPPDIFARSQPSGNVGGSLLTKTLEQERRSHIDSVVGYTQSNPDFSLEKEKREDLKCSMLAEIDSLLTSLSMEEVNLERIPTVNMKSTYEEVETTLKILRHKNDQTRCCTFAEEALMFAAYALEDLFDGKQVWFGRWSPDLTGYHNQMNVKLRRVRYDTGQIVGAIMEDYNIGPGFRIGLEIIPNMFLYSKMRKQQHAQPGLNTDDAADVERANTNLRNL
jgi:hypothetical protein